MLSAPQAHLDVALASEARGSGFESHEERQLVIVKNAIITSGKMLLLINIPNWNKSVAFYYPLDQVDSELVKVHLAWKISGCKCHDIMTSAVVQNWSDEPEMLTLSDWRYS